MSSMNITKSKFMEFVRCNRYAPLNNILKRKDLDDDLNDRYNDIIDSLHKQAEDLGEDFLTPDMEHLRIMMPYFDEVEKLAARKVMSEWHGETRYGTTFAGQKQFIRDYKNFVLMCYVDIYNKDESQVNIIEVKATTSRKFADLGYKSNGELVSIFEKYEDGVYHLKEERNTSWLDDDKYVKNRNKLFDRFSDVGVYSFDLAFQRFVIERDLPDAKYYLGVLNHEYVFDGQYYDGEPVYENDIITFIDLTKITREMLTVIESKLETVVKSITDDDESRVHLGKHCQLKKQRECIYKDVCYDRFPELNSILHYIDRHHGFKEPSGEKHELFDLINYDDKYTMESIPDAWLTRQNNRIQRECAITHNPHINQNKIQDGINELQYPIYHLDFESFPCPLPRFKGEKAYTQSLFQFSLHIEREPGVCDKERDHYEYLSRDHNDNRLELVTKMCEAIPSDGGSV